MRSVHTIRTADIARNAACAPGAAIVAAARSSSVDLTVGCTVVSIKQNIAAECKSVAIDFGGGGSLKPLPTRLPVHDQRPRE